MALSNTATPLYYGHFRDAVMRGEIPICKEIEMEMHRIDDLIKNPGIYYDDKAMDGFVKFCENELTLTDGGDLQLLDTFKLFNLTSFVVTTNSMRIRYKNRSLNKVIPTKYLLSPKFKCI